MELSMRKKLATAALVVSTLVGMTVSPSYADDDTFQSIVQFPVRVVGTGVGTVVGVPLGAVKDGVKGYIMSTKWVAEKLGDEDGTYQTWWGAVFGGPFGLVGGSAYGCFDGAVHGMKSGYSDPFGPDTWTFHDE
jgi:hypothetical protein